VAISFTYSLLFFIFIIKFSLDDERSVTPHTSFEELVAAQCQELEDAMITEVMAFYKAFNRKLDEIRKRHLRDDNLGGQVDEPQVLDMSQQADDDDGMKKTKL